MFYLTCAVYLTLPCAFAIDSSSPSYSESNENKISLYSPSDNFSLIDEIVEDIHRANSSNELLDLVKSLQNTSIDGTDPNKDKPSRRFFSWITHAFKKIDEQNMSKATESPMEDRKKSMLSEKEVFLQRYLFVVLQNLTQAIEKLNMNLELMDPLRIIPLDEIRPLRFRSRRNKREVKGSVSQGDNANNSTDASQSPLPLAPLPSPTTDDLNITLCTPTRRLNKETNSAVKQKLLGFLNDTFKEISMKIRPMQQIKKLYAKDKVFRIGYIVANIDTLEVSIINLKKDMDENKYEWEDSKILDLFDKFVVSNKVVTNLIESLNSMQTVA